MFLYVDYFYFGPKTKLSRRGQRQQSPARGRELRGGGRVWCVCVTPACLTGTYSSMCMLLWLLSWEVVLLLLVVGLRPGLGLGRTKAKAENDVFKFCSL